MKTVVIGGGPAGLYLAILLKKSDPSQEVLVLERNRPDDTYGFGVVFSDATLDTLADADPETSTEISDRLYHWDDIDVHYRGEVLSSTGHGFSGLERKELLEILTRRAEGLGAELRFETEVDDPSRWIDDADLLVGADGLNSTVRERWAGAFEPTIDWRPNKFVWLGTTMPFTAFKFYFRSDNHGLWRVHAYRYSKSRSTFIVETTEETLAKAGLEESSEDATLDFCERLFAEVLDGHRLVANRSIWRSFPTVTCGAWHRGNVVLIGDAAHTAHFSVGSGTRMAMEDAIALARRLEERPDDLEAALAGYEAERRPEVESLQRAAKASLTWFEGTERYMETEPIQFAFNLLTRSLRITHEDLKLRDLRFTRRVDRWFAERAILQSGADVPLDPPPPPLFTPFRVRDLVLANRVVVSAMCQYSADDGTIDDWHFVHLGSRAVGGAGLVMTEMTDVSRSGRISPGCAGIYKPRHVVAWRRIVDFVHDHSYAKIGIQLGHAGRKGSTRLAWEGMDEPLEEDNWEILAPSPIPYFEHSQVPRPMDRGDMGRVIDEHVRAARMADEAGFDLLEVHMAHGYLLGTFVSPATNRRQDAYGGSLANRMRYPLEVLDAVRNAWPDKPLSVRISAVDWVPEGQQIEESVAVARMLADHGTDIVDVSAGQTVPHASPEYGRQFQTPFSDRIRHEAGVPTMAVGNISSYMDVNTILAAGRADLCALARAHLWDPYWTRNAAHKLGWDLPWPPPYSTLDEYTPRFD